MNAESFDEKIPDYILEKIQYVAGYLKGLTNDWLDVKKQIIGMSHTDYRKLFSRRHFSTKKHTLNAFELAVIAEWKRITGEDLYLSPDKTHDPNWVRKGYGWYMSEHHGEYYEKRRLKREEREKAKSPAE